MTLHSQRKRLPRKSSFNRVLLPCPADYFRSQAVILFGAGRWRSALCPFHSDAHPSLRACIDTGAFRCMSCGAHGGDVLGFHMLRYRMSFVDAAKALGAWESER